RLTLPFLLSLAAAAPGLCAAQVGGAAGSALNTQAPVPDSIAVVGSRRNTPISVIQISGLVPGHPINYRDVQRAIQALYNSGQFDDVAITQTEEAGRTVVVIHVHERPLLVKWAIRGVERLPEHSVRDKVTLAETRPLDLAAVERTRARIDSFYHAQGYYLAHAKPLFAYEHDSAGGRGGLDLFAGRRRGARRAGVHGETQLR